MVASRWIALGSLAWIVLFGGVNLYIQATPPAPVAADAPPSDFSSERAFVHVQACAQRPHPMGSADNARVRDYVAGAFRAIGYDVHVQRDPLFHADDAEIQMPENIYAKLPGTHSTGGVMLMAHYDSVPFGPGASDDICGVSAILETARALKAGPPPANDIVFFITDGEERANCGPEAFLQSHPWRKDVTMVMNFESRGTTGPSMMFHTNARNGGIVREFLKAAPYPVSSSMMFDVAGRMPTSTDYWTLKKAGMPGLDFAFVGNIPYYHSMNDSPENVDHRTLQHHGSYALALARHFGNLDLKAVAWDAEPEIYFNTFGHQTVHYSQMWTWPLSVLTIAAVLAALATGRLRGKLRTSRLFASIAVNLAAAVLVPLFSAVPVYFGFKQFGIYALYNQPFYVPGLVLLAVSLFLGVYVLFTRAFTAEERVAGPLLIALPFVLLITIFAPLAAYLLAWPILLTALGVLIIALLPESYLLLRAAIACAASVPALLLLPPALFSFFDTVTFTPAPIVLIGFLFLFGLLLPALDAAIRWRGGVLAFGCLAAAFSLLFYAILNTNISPARPLMDSVDFAANFDTHKAQWASLDQHTDEWTRQLFTGDVQTTRLEDFMIFPGGEEKRSAPAAMPKPSDAHIDVESDALEGARRHVQVRVHPGNNTSEFTLLAPPGLHVFSAKALGNEFGTHDDKHASWLMHYVGRAEAGVPCEFEVAPEDDFKLVLIELRYGLPEFEGTPYAPRPPYIIPEPNTTPVCDFSAEGIRSGNALEFFPDWRSDRTYLRKTYAFPRKANS